MRLFEEIVKANHAAPTGPVPVELPSLDSAEALPVIALTCIDARLNALLPERLGITEEQFIWLRNAGNIVTSSLSSTLRSLALACAVKRGKEIAVIGHTDCQVCKTTMLKLTEALRSLGIERQSLPDNLVEYFGLFASERQNVMRGVEFIRNSPLIGRKVPVHGFMLDIQSGRLEWVVNGYEVAATSAHSVSSVAHRAEALAQEALQALPDLKSGEVRVPAMQLGDVKLSDLHIGGLKLPQVQVGSLQTPEIKVGFASGHPEFKIGEIQLPEIKVGEKTLDPARWLGKSKAPPSSPGEGPKPSEQPADDAATNPLEHFDRSRRYRVIGLDQKVYGPIQGQRILQWLSEGRITWETPSQLEGMQEWRPLGLWSAAFKPQRGKLPPKLTSGDSPPS